MEDVTIEQVNEWKAKYKRVFKVTLDKVDYYYTTLKKDDYMKLITRQSMEEDFDYEYETLSICLLSPAITKQFKSDLNDKSGLGYVLLEQVMVKSGWEQVESEEL
jgi:hypothetical protein